MSTEESATHDQATETVPAHWSRRTFLKRALAGAVAAVVPPTRSMPQPPNKLVQPSEHYEKDRVKLYVRDGTELLYTLGKLERENNTGKRVEITCLPGLYDFTENIQNMTLPAVHKSGSSFITGVGLRLPLGIKLTLNAEPEVADGRVQFKLPSCPIGVYADLGESGSLSVSNIEFSRQGIENVGFGEETEIGGVRAVMLVQGNPEATNQIVKLSNCEVVNTVRSWDYKADVSGIVLNEVGEVHMHQTKILNPQWDGVLFRHGKRLVVDGCTITRDNEESYRVGSGIGILADPSNQYDREVRISNTNITNFIKNVGFFNGGVRAAINNLRVHRTYGLNLCGGWLFAAYSTDSNARLTVIDANEISVTGTVGVQSPALQVDNFNMNKSQILVDNRVLPPEDIFHLFNFQRLPSYPGTYAVTDSTIEFQFPPSALDKAEAYRQGFTVLDNTQNIA